MVFLADLFFSKGSLLLWDSRTPHGNWPNESSQWRMVQYTGMFPAPDDQRLQARRSVRKRKRKRHKQKTKNQK